MASGVFAWSLTAGSNSNADSAINWAEGQAPSSVNDSSRAIMAKIKEWNQDISGALETAGTSTAYTLTSNQVFDSLSNMNGHCVAFRPHATNGASPTLNVRGLGAKALVISPGIAVPLGTLIDGVPYAAVYINADNEWLVFGLSDAAHQIPIGAMVDYTGATAPTSSFVIPLGQAISRTTYATYFALVSTLYGIGDGVNTFNVPDLGGRAVVCKETSESRITTAVAGFSGGTLGAAGGLQSRTVAQANLPNVTWPNTFAIDPSTHEHVPKTNQIFRLTSGGANGYFGTETGSSEHPQAQSGAFTHQGTALTITGSVTSGGSGTALATHPPTIVLNKILRVL